MVVIISNSVWDKIDEYARALTRYPITNKRAHEKVDHMIKFLMSLGNSVVSPPICMYKDLLQQFDSSGNPLNKNLKRVNYEDASKYQWAFACLFDEENDTITVLKMMSARNVRESTNKPLTIITQSELKRMIDESVRRVLAERRNHRLNEAVSRSFRRVLREHITRNR